MKKWPGGRYGKKRLSMVDVEQQAAVDVGEEETVVGLWSKFHFGYRSFRCRNAAYSCLAINALLSLLSLQAVLSLCGVNALLSVASVNSILSVGCSNSILSVGCNAQVWKNCLFRGSGNA